MFLKKRQIRQLMACALFWTCGAVLWLPSSAMASPPFAPEPDPPIVDMGESAVRLHSSLFQALSLEEWTFHKTTDNFHPDGNEQQFIWFMNRARANPPREGAWLADTGDTDVDGAINFFGVDLAVLQEEFDLIDARPPAAFDVRLYEAARAHSENLILRDAQDHDGQFDRIDASGFQYTQAAGVVFSYMRSTQHGYAAFNIDWGADGGDGTGMQPGRGHRSAIMSISGDYTSMGVAAVAVDDSEKTVGPMVTTGNFCKADTTSTDHHNRFLVGTIWQDTNRNDQYDPGEGMGGITVMPDTGPYYAITANSGGYAIPMVAPNTYAVTFSGGGMDTPVTRTAVVGSESVLLDVQYEPADSSQPQAISSPASDITATTAKLNGTVVPDSQVTNYYFQYGLTTDYGSTTATDSASTESDVAAIISGLTENTVYHFRLVAFNGEGTSYGSDQVFETTSSIASTDDERSGSQTVSDSGGGGGGCFIMTARE